MVFRCKHKGSFSALPLKANWKDGSWHGYKYKRGQFITSLQSLSKETGLSVRQVRTALKHLISTGEVTSWHDSKIRIITVVSFDKFQARDKQSDKQVTSKRQSSDKQATTDIRTYKNSKNIKKKEGESTFDPDDYVYDFATTDVDDDDW